MKRYRDPKLRHRKHKMQYFIPDNTDITLLDLTPPVCPSWAILCRVLVEDEARTQGLSDSASGRAKISLVLATRNTTPGQTVQHFEMVTQIPMVGGIGGKSEAFADTFLQRVWHRFGTHSNRACVVSFCFLKYIQGHVKNGDNRWNESSRPTPLTAPVCATGSVVGDRAKKKRGKKTKGEPNEKTGRGGKGRRGTITRQHYRANEIFLIAEIWVFHYLQQPFTSSGS